MKPVGNAIQRMLRQLGLERDLAGADAVVAWPSAAVTVLGPDADQTRPVRVEHDTLVVVVPTAQWAAEIRLRERELIVALGVRGRTITRIRPVPGGDGSKGHDTGH